MLNTRLRRPRSAIAIFAALCALSGAACSSKVQSAQADDYRVGDLVPLPPLTYSILQSSWTTQLGEFPLQRVSTRNFLLVRVSVTNGGGAEATVPFFVLENSAGEKFTELQDGTGLEHWMGLLRTVKPAETLEGWVLFDAPANSYRLRIADTADATAERAAYVQIPLQLD